MQDLSRRSWLRLTLAGAAALGLAACSSAGFPGGENAGAEVAAAAPPSAPPANVIGQGATKVALLLPLSGAGNIGAVGKSMENAARMAMAEFNKPQIQVIVEDSAGTADGARAAAQAALSQGAELILGPVFAAGVSAVAPLAQQANVPVIAFSTDANVARPGVYLLSFLPKSDVNRIVSYAASQGRKSFMALVPDTAYGTVVQGAFQEEVPQVGGRIVALASYGRGNEVQMRDAAKQIAAAAPQADAILLPDGGDTVPQLVAMLSAAGVDTHRLLLMGTGQWNDPRILKAPALQGGVFPAPATAGFQAFSQRYQSRFGSAPVRTATLSYDAVLLAAALTQTQGPDRFSQRVLTNPSGFQGIDGIFRLRADGTNERGLAVLQITPSGTSVVSPAPQTFAGVSGVGL
jgi:ABC-type branched-subunit amino acid transport system substrate-binding protein